MLYHVPKLITCFAKHHKSALLIASSASLAGFAGSLFYALLPVILTDLRNEAFAGLFIAAFTVMQFAVTDPLGGNLADSLGARKVLRIAMILFLCGGLSWMLFGSGLLGMTILSLFIFVSWSLRVDSTYLLRTTPKKEGGLIFGLRDNIMAISCFGSTLALSFFLAPENYWIIGALMAGTASLFLFILMLVKNDLPKPKPIKLRAALNSLATVKHSIHFIKKNKYIPLFDIGSKLFEGLFYGTIWFVIPLHLAKLGTSSAGAGLQLGIYELITIFLAGVAGWAADRYNWRYMHIIGWLMIAAGTIAMPFAPTLGGLIAAGVVIGIGNNIACYAATHALERYDIDHREDGAYDAFGRMISNVGWAIAPVIAGLMYATYSFESSLFICTATGVGLAIWMISLTLHLRIEPMQEVAKAAVLIKD